MEGIIRFSYKRFIDKKAAIDWDKSVFENSYFEFRLQIQNYPNFEKYLSFSEFLKKVPDADKIHHRISPAIYENLNRLHGRIPQITDTFGQLCLEFSKFKFEIIDSDFDHKDEHRVSIEFITEPLLCLGKLGNDFLTAAFEDIENYKNFGEITTLLIPSQPFLNVYSFQKIV